MREESCVDLELDVSARRAMLISTRVSVREDEDAAVLSTSVQTVDGAVGGAIARL